MQFVYKSRVFDIIVNIDQNLIVATYINPQKINYSKDEETGLITKSIGYSDAISVSMPISESFTIGESTSKLFENNNLCFSTIFSKLCAKLDERFKA